MKRFIAVLVAVTICFLTSSVHAEGKVTMYAPDGREIIVALEDVQAYKNVGWYEHREDIIKVMYAPDGRQIAVYLDEVPAYRSVGWYDNKADVTKTMYAPDGRELTVFLDHIEAYKNVGWYENIDEVSKIMYAPDGRTTRVFLGQIEAYKKVGWYENKSDVTTTMYSVDGRTLTVYIDQIPVYKSVGWYEKIEDVSIEMYSVDGRTVRVFLNDVSAYKAVGWYDDIEKVSIIMYAPDGRTLRVFLTDIQAYKNVGWYENKSDVTTTMYAEDGREITVFLGDIEAYKNVGWSLTRPYRIDLSKPMIALTFDDGPKASNTSIVLDTLEKNGARATFFVLGSLAKNNPAIIQRMVKLGCQVGNHTYNHPDLKTLSDSNVANQINNTQSIIKNITGFEPSVIRPPYGSYNNHIMEIAKKPFILWSVDTLDWKYRDAEYVKNHVLSHASDGAINLMHDIHASTAEAIKSIVPELIKRGFQLVTVEDLAKYKGYTMSAGKSYSSFK